MEAVRDGHCLLLGTPRARTVLALLLAHANTIVSIDRLTEELWPQGTAVDTRAEIYAYVSRLRHSLGQRKGGPSWLLRRSPGYQLCVRPGELDLDEFAALVGTARQSRRDGDLAGAAATYRKALALWRGTAFEGVRPTPAIEAEISRLGEQRLLAQEELADCELGLGQAGELVAGLTALAARHPLRERLHALLMRALYQAGRPAEALSVHHDLATALAGELGVAPGPELVELHQRILHGRLDPPAPPAPAAPVAEPPRRTGRNDLQADLVDFTGRQDELRRLLAALPDPAAPAGSALVITAIDGMAGVGKTTLAVHAAHRLAEHFPDGSLFIDLHAHTAGHEPIDPANALDTLLRAIGVPGEKIPERLDARAALWRAELADRRALLVLDNASSAAQVRPLLPGAAGCLTLVTSRRRLTDLDTAITLSLDVLTEAAAADLFTRTVANPPATADAAAVAEVVGLCGRQPLALRIAAARLRARPAWTAAHLAARLRDERRTLTELAAGDRCVGTAFSLSYHQLTPAQARLFRLLGLVPGADFDCHQAAALAGLPLAEAEDLLEDLVDVHLVGQPAPGRYRFHDLLRHYARGALTQDETAPTRLAAVDRLFAYYRGATAEAAELLDPGQTWLPEPPAPQNRLTSYDDAVAWLDAEYPNLFAAVSCALEGGCPNAWQIAHALEPYFDLRGHAPLRLQLALVEASQARGDRHAEACGRLAYAVACDRVGRYREAEDQISQALALFREAGFRPGVAATLRHLGGIYEPIGAYREAIASLTEALGVYHELGDLAGQGDTENALANVLLLRSNYPEALRRLDAALRLYRAGGQRGGEGIALINLGVLCLRTSRYRRAITHFREALEINREIGSRLGIGGALNNLGHAYLRVGRLGPALDLLNRALELNQDGKFRRSEANTLVNLAQAVLRTGKPVEAARLLERALGVFHEIGCPSGEGIALCHLGEVRLWTGQRPEAAQHLLRGLEIQRETGNLFSECMTLNHLGELHRGLGDAANARVWFEQALQTAGLAHNRHEQAHAHRGLAAVLDGDAGAEHRRLAREGYRWLARNENAPPPVPAELTLR
ncbi:tetratricopeptide (TPR) repeat protein [Crossiella equi]|uniref:Tetratricopeptide (TPR) repeat protein n=1 Tax=Crossiella equi TaxID=130796 RepID=A0ABS5AMT6_9PSEU|nr:BTAD domain-containing putative transcriptional regulator [Crossiella equi]MBP2477873.1 tetratricopeptide (TPR) repeat protein [Crossiella equi]